MILPHVRRAAVEVLGQVSEHQSMDAVLAQLKKTDGGYDNHLYYTAGLALRNILRIWICSERGSDKNWRQDDVRYSWRYVDVPFLNPLTSLRIT